LEDVFSFDDSPSKENVVHMLMLSVICTSIVVPGIPGGQITVRILLNCRHSTWCVPKFKDFGLFTFNSCNWMIIPPVAGPELGNNLKFSENFMDNYTPERVLQTISRLIKWEVSFIATIRKQYNLPGSKFPMKNGGLECRCNAINLFLSFCLCNSKYNELLHSP